jgi:hypothetical protein
MKRIKTALLTVWLGSGMALSGAIGGGQGQTPQHGESQKSQDVPQQQPGTDNPDLGKQRQTVPKTKDDTTGGAAGNSQPKNNSKKKNKSKKKDTNTSTQSSGLVGAAVSEAS